MENISKYLEDKRFISWVFGPDEELEKWWKHYAFHHPEEKYQIEKARKILFKLKTTDKQLTDQEKILLFSGILKEIEIKQESKGRKTLVVSLLKYAAVAVLFFSLGALLFYRNDNLKPEFYSKNLSEPTSGDVPRLIRSDGEKVELDEQNSKIEYRQNGQVVVNNNVLNAANPAEIKTPDLNQLVIPYGNTSEIILSDGTKVYLNAGSRLVYPDYFADKNREVFLVGEAFFEVEHDEDHPFIVQTTDIRVKVLGTQFNISAYPSDNIIETVLTQGNVRIEKNNSGFFTETSELKPGQLAAFNKKSRETSIRTVNPDNYVLWKEGILKFESTDFSRIVKKLERFYNISFKYNDPLTGTIKISGKLEFAGSVQESLNSIALAASVEIIKKGENNYEISR